MESHVARIKFQKRIRHIEIHNYYKYYNNYNYKIIMECTCILYYSINVSKILI